MPDDTIHGLWISLFIVKCITEAVSVNSIRLIEKVFVVELSQYGISITFVVLPHEVTKHIITNKVTGTIVFFMFYYLRFNKYLISYNYLKFRK